MLANRYVFLTCFKIIILYLKILLLFLLLPLIASSLLIQKTLSDAYLDCRWITVGNFCVLLWNALLLVVLRLLSFSFFFLQFLLHESGMSYLWSPALLPISSASHITFYFLLTVNVYKHFTKLIFTNLIKM